MATSPLLLIPAYIIMGYAALLYVILFLMAIEWLATWEDRRHDR